MIGLILLIVVIVLIAVFNPDYLEEPDSSFLFGSFLLLLVFSVINVAELNNLKQDLERSGLEKTEIVEIKKDIKQREKINRFTNFGLFEKEN